MELARHRALTHSPRHLTPPWVPRSRNGASPPQGIDTRQCIEQPSSSTNTVEMELARHRALTQITLSVPIQGLPTVEMELARHRALTQR